MRLGRWSGNSHGRTLVCRIGSSVGGLSTMYEIHACQPGSMCDLLWAACQRSVWGVWLRMRGDIRIEFFVFVVYPSCSHCWPVRSGIVCGSSRPVLRGNSSARFSKYLLPYRSVAIKVPALVSPIQRFSNHIIAKDYGHVPMYCGSAGEH